MPKLSQREIGKISVEDDIVSFSGSRHGLTDIQAEILWDILSTGPRTVFHGDCVGADTVFHDLCLLQGISGGRLQIFPGPSEKWRAFNNGGVVMPVRPNHARNRLMVILSEVLVACPATKKPVKDSGTWYTIKYARSRAVKTYVIRPDGKVVKTQ